MANYYIAMLAPSLKIHGGEYLRKKFQYRCQLGKTGLDATASIIFAQFLPIETNFKNTIAELSEAGVLVAMNIGNSTDNISSGSVNVELTDILMSTTSRNNIITNNTINSNNNLSIQSLPSLSKCIIAKTFIAILQLPVRLNTPEGYYLLPETYHFDSDRLSILRDMVDRISIESSIMIATRQILVKYQVPPSCIDAKSELDLHHR